MEISVKQLVMVFLGLFLLKIAVADPYRHDQQGQAMRRPSSLGSSNQTGPAPKVITLKNQNLKKTKK